MRQNSYPPVGRNDITPLVANLSIAFRYFYSSLLICCFALAALVTPAYAQSWSLTGLDGVTKKVTVDSIEDGKVIGDQGQWSLDEFRLLKTSHALLGADPSTTEVSLIGGGVVFAREINLESGKIRLETDVCELEYDIFDVRCIVFKKGEGEEELTKLRENPSSESDQLLVTTSQGARTVSGLVESVNKDSVSIDYKGELRTIALDKVIALLPASLDSGRKILGLLKMIDRSELLVQRLSFADEQWTVSWGPNQVQLDAESVASVSIRSDRQIYLSDLQPIRNEVQTSLAPRRETKWDSNIFGQAIRLYVPANAELVEWDSKLQEFAKGIGTQSRSRISFAVPQGSKRLTGWVGIDANARPNGDCICSILVDGIQVFSTNVTGASNAVRIDLVLDEAPTEIQLLVEPGKQLDLSDWVNWADIRFLK